jgi:hypothetical protein
MGLNVLQQLQSSRAYKNVFPSLSMKCASCCCPNNVVDCIALHCMQRGGPICACCLLALITLCTNYQALYGLQAMSNPTPLPTKLTSNQLRSWAPHCFFALELSLSLSLHIGFAWDKRVTLSLG